MQKCNFYRPAWFSQHWQNWKVFWGERHAGGKNMSWRLWQQEGHVDRFWYIFLNCFFRWMVFIVWIEMYLSQGIHAREWIGPAANLYMLNKLVNKASKGQNEDLFLVDWYIMPGLNPDGYVYTWTTNRMWRKTRWKTEACIFSINLICHFKTRHQRTWRLRWSRPKQELWLQLGNWWRIKQRTLQGDVQGPEGLQRNRACQPKKLPA